DPGVHFTATVFYRDSAVLGLRRKFARARFEGDPAILGVSFRGSIESVQRDATVVNAQVKVGIPGRSYQQHRSQRMIVLACRRVHGDVGSVDLEMCVGQDATSLVLVIGSDLFAELEADFRFVPAGYLNFPIVLGRNGQRLVWNGL